MECLSAADTQPLDYITYIKTKSDKAVPRCNLHMLKTTIALAGKQWCCCTDLHAYMYE